MKTLTKRQAEILAFIEKYTEEHNCAPTFREVQTAFSFSSVASAAKHIQALQKRGLLIKPSQKSARSALPTEERSSKPSTKLPLIGAISSLRVEIFQRGQEALFPPLPQKPRAYAFLIKDNSFHTNHILEGDIIAIEAKNSADEGDVTLATYKGCPKIGLFSEHDDAYFLGEEKFTKEDLLILGTLFFLIRSY